MKTPVFVGVGANLGDPLSQIRHSLDLLRSRYGEVEEAPVFLTEPVGGPDQPPYVNTVVRFETSDPPLDVLQTLQGIEARIGRTRNGQVNAPRILDLDLILYGGSVIRLPGLEIPHPRFRQRRFVLVPFAAKWPEIVDPVTGKTILQLLKELTDEHWVRPLTLETS